jgi:hypothetical protein
MFHVWVVPRAKYQNCIPISASRNGIGNHVAFLYRPDVYVVAKLSGFRNFLPEFFVRNDASICSIVCYSSGFDVREQDFSNNGFEAIASDEKVECVGLAFLRRYSNRGAVVFSLRYPGIGNDMNTVSSRSFRKTAM